MIHTSPRVTERRQARSDAIVEAAMQLCSAEGLRGLTVHRLSAELGITAGALYRYYPSFDALLAACELRALGQLDERLRTAATRVAPGERFALDRVIAAVLAYASAGAALPAATAFLRRLLAEPQPQVDDLLAAPLVETFWRLLAPISEALQIAERRKTLAPQGAEPPRVIVLFAAIAGAAQLEKLERFSTLKMTELVWHTTRALLIGWGAAPKRVDAAYERVLANA